MTARSRLTRRIPPALAAFPLRYEGRCWMLGDLRLGVDWRDAACALDYLGRLEWN